MRRVFFLFFALGLFSLLSQTLIVREFIVSFGGNELGIGLFYFFWLFWVGIGAYLTLTIFGKFLEKHFLRLLFFYPPLSFLEIILFIGLRQTAGIGWWEFFTLEKVFLYLFLFTSFISLFTGIIFTLGVLWVKPKEKDTSATISSGYIFESFGSFFAGSIVTFLIIKLFSPLIILLLGGLFFSLVAAILAISFKDKIGTILNLSLGALLLFSSFNFQRVIDFSQHLRTKNLLPQLEQAQEVYTPYQHLLLGKLSSQLVVVANGEVLSSIPEVLDADKMSALFLSQAKGAQDILIFGFGAENLINSFLKLPVGNITFVCEDEVYYRVVHQNLPPPLKKRFQDERLKVIFQSPRLFLKRNQKKFDFAVILTPEPSNLVLNAFFTQEFYSLLKKNLKKEGAIATQIRSAENFIGEEIKNYGSSLYYTLKKVFPKIVIVPGEINWFFAAGPDSYLSENPQILKERFKEMAFKSSFSPEAFASLLPKERVEFIKDIYRENPFFQNTGLTNQDSQPLTFFLNLLVLARYSNSYLIKFFKNAYLAALPIFLVPILLFFIMRLSFLLRIENIKTKCFLFNAKLFQLLSGFLGFSYHLSLIFLFQNKFGTIFQLIGLVNSLFMLGLGLGGWAGASLIKKFSPLKTIIAVLLSQAVVILCTYPIFVQANLSNNWQFFLFVVFFLMIGIITGSSYPLAAKILENLNSPLKNTAANLELLDHWGGSLAGLVAGLLMLPLLGVFKTLILLMLLVLGLAILLILSLIPFGVFAKERRPSVLSFPYIRTSYFLITICLIFVVNCGLLKKKVSLWQEQKLKPLKVEEGCFWQKEPFFAQVCRDEEGKLEYSLESKNFAPQIKGFSGPINLLIRVAADGKIKQISALEHKEAAAYVEKIADFLNQFKGRYLSEKFSRDSVDAISGATITSSAIIEIINKTAKELEGKLIIPEPQTFIPKLGKERIIFDSPAVTLLIFTFFAIIFYLSPYNLFLRKIYLLLVVIFLGFSLNLTFSFAHLSNLINLNLPSLRHFGLFLIYLIPLVLGLFFGQIWCGWLCPFGALQEILGSFRRSPRKVSAKLETLGRYFKYLFLAAFIVIVSVGASANLFKQEPLTIFFLNPTKIGGDKLLSLVILFFSIFFLRFWCRYFCVGGAFLSFFNKFFIFKKFFLKKYEKCPFNVKGLHDLDCLQCNQCLKRDEPRNYLHKEAGFIIKVKDVFISQSQL